MSRYAFYDLPADAFPFVIEFTRADTGAVVHRIEVTGPGAITVPGLGRQLGGVRIDARVVQLEKPPGDSDRHTEGPSPASTPTDQ